MMLPTQNDAHFISILIQFLGLTVMILPTQNDAHFTSWAKPENPGWLHLFLCIYFDLDNSWKQILPCLPDENIAPRTEQRNHLLTYKLSVPAQSLYNISFTRTHTLPSPHKWTENHTHTSNLNKCKIYIIFYNFALCWRKKSLRNN
jgi:hypothetical protein